MTIPLTQPSAPLQSCSAQMPSRPHTRGEQALQYARSCAWNSGAELLQQASPHMAHNACCLMPHHITVHVYGVYSKEGKGTGRQQELGG